MVWMPNEQRRGRKWSRKGRERTGASRWNAARIKRVLLCDVVQAALANWTAPTLKLGMFEVPDENAQHCLQEPIGGGTSTSLAAEGSLEGFASGRLSVHAGS